jgi:hypothetical protein
MATVTGALSVRVCAALAAAVALLTLTISLDEPRSSNAGVLPDLQVDSIGFFPANPGVGVQVEVTVIARNAGGDCEDCFFSVDFYMSQASAPSPGDFGEMFCALIVPAAGQTVACKDKVTYMGAGPHQTWAQVDTEESLTESNESNNVLGPIGVTAVTDSDGDGVANTSDNCPFWSNPAQTPPAWTIPPDDPDCDGYSTASEDFIGTVFWRPCAANTTANNEDPPDVWPLDMNDDRRASTVDVGSYVGDLGLDSSEVGYTTRLDLDANEIINTVDVGRFVSRLGDLCTP